MITLRKLSLTMAALLLALNVEAAVPSDYWQQTVDYEIEVTLANDGRTISGTEVIVYTNNSPDTLSVLYLKAFPNSARRGSLMDQQTRRFENYKIADSDSADWGSLRIWNVRSRGAEIDFELDDTIYELLLKHPLSPGATERVSLEFETVLPVGIGNRHEYIHGQSKAAYWYPQVCVYDGVMGWVNSPYVGRGECYGDYGSFQVSITAPEDRIVAATGILTNRAEVLPDSLREALDISNYVGEEETWPELDFDTSKTKTWVFNASKVNDFAWVAGKDFCLDGTIYNGVIVEVYAKRSHAKGWTNTLTYATRSLETHSELYGDYGWPTLVVTDSYDGMEYPAITFCRGDGTKASFPLLVYHEIGHFWFMGMIGTNQVDRACLDEGFTNLAEIVVTEKYHGRRGNNVDFSANWYKRNFYPLDEDRDSDGFRPYIRWARAGYDEPMIIPADNANEYRSYRASSYNKPAVMHLSLRSIYGDSLYFRSMFQYGTTWKFKHPYETDFIRSFSGSVDERLSEYFAQWFTSRRQIDYKYNGHKKISDSVYRVTLSSPGDFVTPIDVAFIGADEDTVFYTVNPEGHDFIKPGFHDGGTWRQYRQPSFKYEFQVEVPAGIKKAVIDPYNLLADVNRLNNSSGFFPPIDFHVDAMFYDVPSMHKYSLRWRPDLWYDEPNGLIVGMHTHGSYINTDYKFSLDAAVGTKSGRALIDFKYSHPFKPLGRLAFFEGRVLRTDYRTHAKLGIVKEYRSRWSGPDYLRFELSGNYFNIDGGPRRERFIRGYVGSTPIFFNASVNSATDEQARYFSQPLGLESLWSGAKEIWIESSVNYRKESKLISFSGRASGRFFQKSSEFLTRSYTQLWGQQSVEVSIPKLPKLTLGGTTFHSGPSAPSTVQFAFHLTRAQPFNEYANTKLFRSPGAFPLSWRSDVYLDASGVRGYQGRSLYGGQGTVLSATLSSISLMKRLPVKDLPLIGVTLSRMDTELFIQTGWIASPGKFFNTYPSVYQLETSGLYEPRKYYSSAGVSFVSPSVWNGQQLRLDFPIYLSRPLPGEEKWQFRFSVAWILPLKTEKWKR